MKNGGKINPESEAYQDHHSKFLRKFFVFKQKAGYEWRCGA